MDEACTMTSAVCGTASKAVLYASYVSPYPANSGERIRAVNLIAALRFLGYDVEAIVGNYDHADLTAHGQSGVRFHVIPFAWPRLRQAPHIYFRSDHAFQQQVRSLHQKRAFDAIVLDYGFMGAQIAPLLRLGMPVILGTHNLESALTGQAQRTSLSGKMGIALRQAVESAHERRFFGSADAVICVSEEDRRAYAGFIDADRLHVVPNFVDCPDIYADARRDRRIIMSGSFGNFQNLAGLRWFLREVWDETLRSHATLCIAGQDSERAIAEFSGVPGIVALGAKEDLVAEIARSRCAVVPIQHGGGTRLKCLEAMAARTPIVTTPKGCEGIAHDGTFRVANSAEAFRSAILEILTDWKTARNATARARDIFDRQYSLAANAARLQHVLEDAALQARSRHEKTAPAAASARTHMYRLESLR
jgi:glycosyltransferase involved in cell wall biosynthesis